MNNRLWGRSQTTFTRGRGGSKNFQLFVNYYKVKNVNGWRVGGQKMIKTCRRIIKLLYQIIISKEHSNKVFFVLCRLLSCINANNPPDPHQFIYYSIMLYNTHLKTFK